MASDYTDTLKKRTSNDQLRQQRKKTEAPEPTAAGLPDRSLQQEGFVGRLGLASNQRFTLVRAVVFLGYALLLPIPLVTGNYYLMRAGGSIGIYLMLAAGLSIVAGQAGLLDLGYAGFYGIGAYVYALLASPQFGIHLPFLVAAAASTTAAVLAAMAVSLPTLRLHGDYLAMVTLGFGQIVKILLNNMDRPINITNGPNGIVAIDPPRILGFTFGSMESQYIFIWVSAIGILIGVSRLTGSKVGRAWNALREDETAAACMGVNIKRYRVSAFVGGAAIAGLAGALFALWQGAVFPQNFTMNETIVLYCMIVLGGARSVPGIMLGVLLLQVLPEALRAYSVYRMLIYGFALALLAIFRPQGLIGIGERLIGIVPDKVADIAAQTTHQDCPDGPHSRSTSAQEPVRNSNRATLSAQPILEIEQLSCSFGGLDALTGVNFSMNKGEVLGIIGPNGAGKTTVFNLITGLVEPSSGDIRLNGSSVLGKAPHEVIELGAARTFQNIRLYETQSVLENVLAGCHLRHPVSLPEVLFRTRSHLRKEAEQIIYVRGILADMECGLAERESDVVAELSYPDKRRVEMARALATGARLILLDEPAAGMTAEEIAMVADEIKALQQRGYTIIIIEHHMDLITAVCDRVIVLDHGEKIAEGTCDQVADDPAVIRAYFGSSPAPDQELGKTHSGSDVRPALSLQSPGHEVATSQPLLELVNVHASYGPAKVLQGIELHVQPGEAVALLGVNAAGKSTTLKTITGRMRPSQGEIFFMGERIDGRPTSEIVRMGMGVVPEGRRVFPELSVMENLDIAADSLTSQEQARAGIERAFSLFPILADRRFQMAGTLSGGEQQMLAIARALVTSPRLICMDEPSMGLAPIMVERVMATIAEINRTGTAVLLVEQNARAALSVADRCYFLKDGKIKALSTTDQALADQLRLT
ncbi:MAG: ATP-binding cassette domain-containing protein [Firmicutes bacterium]|nr:ATP-binding cassette domain-containing protein [Bacillota bacterium]